MVATSRLIDYPVASPLVIALALATLAIVGTTDYLTGYQISFSVFYLLPVGFAAWYASRRTGYAFAVASSLTWYIAEIEAGYPYEHAAIPVWNALVRLAFFVIIAALLSVLKRRLQAEKTLARTDPLTGLVNGRMFREQLDHDIALSARLGAALTVAYIDLDDFKLVNDTHGHAAGDAILMLIARAMVAATRRSDTVARLGGDEFALILPGADVGGAQSKLFKLAREFETVSEESGQAMTFSIGAVVIDALGVAAEDVLAAADRLMYIAKNGGKNSIAISCYSDAAHNDAHVYPSGGQVDAAA